MREVRRSVALLSLLLAVLFGLGLGNGHVEHDLDHDHGSALRFGADHASPISEEHVESARRLHEESCPACALQTSTTSLEAHDRRQRLPLLAGRTALESAHADRQFELSLSLGRAPPQV